MEITSRTGTDLLALSHLQKAASAKLAAHAVLLQGSSCEGYAEAQDDDPTNFAVAQEIPYANEASRSRVAMAQVKGPFST